MKKLHHPGTPCNISNSKEYSFSDIVGDNIEAVKCTTGWGIFAEQEFWADDNEFEQLSQFNIIKTYVPKAFDLNRWSFYFPINLEIELTKNCNQRCIHCWNESGDGSFLSESSLERVIGEFRNNGGQRLKLTGGEPLLYPSFLEFLYSSKNKGIRNIALVSNGSLIDDKIAKELSRYIDKINISLHGATQETHNKITSSSNYSKTKNAIELCTTYGIDTLVNFTVMKENMKDIEDIFKQYNGKDIKIRFNLLMQRGYGKDLTDISSDISKLRKQIIRYSKIYDVSVEKSELYPQGYNKDINSAKFYGCSALRTGIYISSTGSIFPCNLAETILGNINRDNLKDIWTNKKAKEVRDITLCDETFCEYICSGKCKAGII